MTEYRRLVINIAPEVYDELQRRADERGISIADLFKRAVALDNFIEDHANMVGNNDPAMSCDESKDCRCAWHSRAPDSDMPLASPGIARASRSLADPPDHPAGIQHGPDEWTTTVAELRKMPDPEAWEFLFYLGGWRAVTTERLVSLDGRFPLRVRRRREPSDG